jgi:ketosteroid isomerase-like protein
VSSEDIDRVRAGLAAWRQGDDDASLGYFHPEVEWINVPCAGVIELEDGLLRRWRDVGTRERALKEAMGQR